MKKINDLESEINEYYDLLNGLEDARVFLELCQECDDENEYKLWQKRVRDLAKEVDDYSLTQLLTGDYDSQSAVMQIHSGAGGLEAQDWTEMLMRMYKRWGDDHHYKVTVLDLLNDTEGGIKSVTMLFEGRNAY